MAVAVDAALWGALQDHIDMPSLIFAKLPLDAFFRLRVVCKEWNRLASDRAFLLEHFSTLLQPPYFVVDTRSSSRLLQRRDDDGGCWTWTRLPSVKCESSGLLLEDCRVFDLHTRLVHAVPDVEDLEEMADSTEEMVMGMIVDATVNPHAFRVVCSNKVVHTRMYESRSGLWWEMDSTQPGGMPKPRPGRSVSAFYDDGLFIRTPGLFSLYWYDVWQDEWSVEMLPGCEHTAGIPGYEYDEWVFCDPGEWEDRLYVVGLNFVRPGSRIQVWELLKPGEMYPISHLSPEDHDGIRRVISAHVHDDMWRVCDEMPDDLWLRMLAGKEEKLKRDCWAEFFDFKSRFCGEYVLVYNSVTCENFTQERAVLYSLKSRKWEKVDLPA